MKKVSPAPYQVERFCHWAIRFTLVLRLDFPYIVISFFVLLVTLLGFQLIARDPLALSSDED